MFHIYRAAALSVLLLAIVQVVCWPVQTHAAPFINARAEGIACDGHTDNADILDRMTALAARGALIYFPPEFGNCLTSRPFHLPSNVTLWAKPGTVTFIPSQSNASSALLLTVERQKDIQIHGLTFDGGGKLLVNQNSLAIIYKSENVIFDHVIFQNSRGIPVVFSTSIKNSGLLSTTIRNVANDLSDPVDDRDRHQGVDFCCGAPSDNHGNFVRYCDLSQISLDGIAISDQVDFDAQHNSMRDIGGFWENGGASIWATNVTGLVISDNFATDSKGNGFDLSFLRGAMIVRNQISKSGGGGIELNSSDKVTIAYNSTTDNWQSSLLHTKAPSQHRGGITLDVTLNSMSKIRIIGNTSGNTENNETQAYGIQVRGGNLLPSLFISMDNRFFGNSVAAVSGEARSR